MKRKYRCDSVGPANNTETELSIRKRINFDEDDTDEEITFDTQAHKKRKISREMEELKVWMDKKLDENKEETKKMIQESLNVTVARGKKNEADIAEIRDSIANIERRMGVTTPAQGSYAGAGLEINRRERISDRLCGNTDYGDGHMRSVTFDKLKNNFSLLLGKGFSSGNIEADRNSLACQTNSLCNVLVDHREIGTRIKKCSYFDHITRGGIHCKADGCSCEALVFGDLIQAVEERYREQII